MKISKYLSLTLCLLLVLAFASAASAQDEGKTLVTSLNMVAGDLETIDPGLAQTSSQIDIINNMYIGLTHQNIETATIEPGMAESWDVSEDGTVYTFHLREGIPWVRYNAESDSVEQLTRPDGTPAVVTAQDFVYAWQRTLDPATGGAYAYVLAPTVVGGNELLAGEGSVEDLGIVAVDDFTLEVTSPESLAYAPGIYALWMARAVPQWLIEEFGDSWTEPENTGTYGPFTLKEWAHDESITLTKNTLWPGTPEIPQPILDNVQFRFLDPAAQFAEFLAGTIHASNIPVEEIPRVQADPELSTMYVTGTNPCTYYIGFDTTEDPTSNVHLRRALSYSIDRQAIVENVTRGGQIAAQWFTYPTLTAAPTLETHPDLGIALDTARAQEEFQAYLDEAGLASAADAPTIILAYNDGSGHAAIAQAIQQMWTDTLGVNVQLSPVDPTGYFSGLREEAPMAFRAGWCQDYSDANNFMYEVYHSSSEFNYARFTDERYDALVEEARSLTDENERRELYAQAEELLVDEIAAIAPIYWYTTNNIIRPNVTVVDSVTGNEEYFGWDIAEDM